jgi:hypothetical protein
LQAENSFEVLKFHAQACEASQISGRRSEDSVHISFADEYINVGTLDSEIRCGEDSAMRAIKEDRMDFVFEGDDDEVIVIESRGDAIQIPG